MELKTEVTFDNGSKYYLTARDVTCQMEDRIKNESQKTPTFIEIISNLIYNHFDNIYCDNCRYVNDAYICAECHRKSMNWAVSREDCDALARRIVFNDY